MAFSPIPQENDGFRKRSWYVAPTSNHRDARTDEYPARFIVENLPKMRNPRKVTVDAEILAEGASSGEPVSYAEAKEIALLRQELRACWDRHDRTAAHAALARMANVAGQANDNELAAEVRRWACRFD